MNGIFPEQFQHLEQVMLWQQTLSLEQNEFFYFALCRDVLKNLATLSRTKKSNYGFLLLLLCKLI